MATNVQLALMAAAAYESTRTEQNQFSGPPGWTPSDRKAQSSGFEAVTFSAGTQIVISYAGTYDKDINDKLANVGLAAGTGSAQLLQAVEYYLQVKALNPVASISLTGHSLGGGLAALVGVFFGVSTQTFDQAPFAQTARFGAVDLKNQLIAKVDGNGLRLYDDGMLAPLTSYITQKEAFGVSPSFIPNENLVTNINVQGEFLSDAPWTIFPRIGSTIDTIANNVADVSGFELHAQALLTAYLQSRETAAADQRLNEVTVKLPELLKMIFDTNLFAARTDNPDKTNLLDHLVRHESGVRDPVTGATAIAADAMLTRFTQDLWRIAQDGGRTLNDGSNTQDLTKALTALAMQKYYEETKDSTGYNKTLFTDLPGGIQFDMADVSTKLANTAAANQKLDLNEAKGFDQYFKNYVKNSSLFSAAESALIQSVLPYVRDWYVQASGNAMVATDVQNRGAFMLGGSGSDILVGGAKTDLLVGGSGADILQGRGGNDILAGGLGSDTYLYQADLGDTGQDTIIDRDGLGLLVVDGQTLSGGNQYGDNRVYRDAQGYTYTQLGGNRLAIDGKFMVEGWSAGKLGISNGPRNPTSRIVASLDIEGDLAWLDLQPQVSGITPGWDAQGNYIRDPNQPEPGMTDVLNDSAGNDNIQSKAGNDTITAFRGGDDLIDAGSGQDRVSAGSGDDLVVGGAGVDFLFDYCVQFGSAQASCSCAN